ncbi:hypothetical protein ACXET9_00805 [Brachybacterium sp. DNPG3]
MRPEAPFYVGRTRPTAVGWTRIGMTLVAGAAATVVISLRPALATPALLIASMGVFVLLAAWTWMNQSTRFIVDEHGVTVSLGGFLPMRPWPLEQFRTVQLREIPAERVGATVGGYGWRRGRALSSTPEELRPVGSRRVFTTGDSREPYRLLVTRSGTMVEIIGREGTHFLLSPEDPQATAEAVDQAIRSRR